ncbi:MAG: helix-turn-helix transcriptional regulator [Chitinophagaceae bacterium]
MKKILETPLDELFSQLITPDHLHISGQTELIALQHLSVDPKENVVVNLEYNIRFGGKKIKRLLLQIMAGSLDSNGFPTLLYGYVTDISHIIPDGPPRMTVMNGSRVETIIHSWPEGISAETRFKLTHRELSVLVHKRQGLRTKEIAQHLKLREMTVYSIIRDIKKKTGMDIIPLINLLVQNGTIAR